MLPSVKEENTFQEYVAGYLAPTVPEFEISLAGVLAFTGGEDDLLCSYGVFEGLYETEHFSQELRYETKRQVPIDSKDAHLFADHVIEDLYQCTTLGSECKTVRLCIDKYTDQDFKPRYTKYLDIDLVKVRSERDKKVLHNIVYYLFRFSAGGKFLIESKRRCKDASKIWTLFPEQVGRGDMPAQIQAPVHRQDSEGRGISSSKERERGPRDSGGNNPGLARGQTIKLGLSDRDLNEEDG